MAALETIRFVPFAVPPSNPPFCNRNTLWHDQTRPSIRSVNTSGSQKIRKSADPLSRSGYQADRNGAARAQDPKHTLADNDDESDDHFPSLEELSRAALSSKISTEASKTKCTLQRLEQPAVHSVGLQVNPTQSELGERQGICQAQPVILDDNGADNAGAGNEVEGAFGHIDTRHIGWNASPHIAASSELVSTPTESINTSGPWYDVEETYYVEPAPGLLPRPYDQHGVPATLAQSQLQTVPRSSTPLQDQISQQDIDDITQSTSMESAPRSLLKPSDNGIDGWTDDSMAELEKELGLALEELQVELPSAGTPTSPSPRSAEAPPDGIQSREYTETTSSRPEELQDTSGNGTAQGLREWELQETEVEVEGGPVAMQQQKGLGDPDVGDQDLVEVVDADDLEDKEATEILLAAEPKILVEHRFRLRGIRTQPLAGRQTKTTQYRIVWGDRLNRSDSWFNEEEIRISILRPSCERSSQDSVLPVERDISRVHRMRLDKRSKGKGTFEYLVDEPRTWITEDQLRISLSPILVAELKGSCPRPLSEAQPDVLLTHSATLINDEYRHASRASRSSAPADPVLEDNPTTPKRGHQDMHTDISSDIHHPANTDNNHNACDTSDEDPRPAKRRKPRLASTMTTTTSRRYAPKVHVRQAGPFVALSTATSEIDDAQLQVDHECQSTFVVSSHQHTSRLSRSPSEASEAASVTEHRQWPFQGFLNYTRVGDNVTYNLEFKLPSVSECVHIPIDRAALESDYKAAAHSKTPLKSKKSRVPWSKKENAILRTRKSGCSWKAIHKDLPGRSMGAIQVRYSTMFKTSEHLYVHSKCLLLWTEFWAREEGKIACANALASHENDGRRSGLQCLDHQSSMKCFWIEPNPILAKFSHPEFVAHPITNSTKYFRLLSSPLTNPRGWIHKEFPGRTETAVRQRAGRQSLNLCISTRLIEVAAAYSSLPAEIGPDYVMFATSESGDLHLHFPYKPRSFSLRVHLSEQN
ncbi:hypothetical protein VTL71DRAFT_5033 [Oculimacula yallundae]|uniref:Myb-like domain-containing protein n=1 Tax=Oculimacula yallundae TaxID=86028 RepID=A0ABR4C1L6_9HELO